MKYIANDGRILYTEYEYVLDIINTNLNCYTEDFFRNYDNNFGNNGMDIQDVENIKSTINDIIKNRCAFADISVVDVRLNANGIVSIELAGSFGQKSAEIDLSNKSFYRVIPLE